MREMIDAEHFLETVFGFAARGVDHASIVDQDIELGCQFGNALGEIGAFLRGLRAPAMELTDAGGRPRRPATRAFPPPNADNTARRARSIDVAISSVFDLQITLTILINEVVKQLNVDAVSILLIQPGSSLKAAP